LLLWDSTRLSLTNWKAQRDERIKQTEVVRNGLLTHDYFFSSTKYHDKK